MKNLPIIWDFDGVIVDSVNIRTEGFKTVLKDYSKEEIKKLINYHLKNKGKSRFEKFDYFFKEIVNNFKSEEEIFAYVKKFCDLMKERINKKLLFENILTYIKEKYKEKEMHIISASYYLELQ